MGLQRRPIPDDFAAIAAIKSSYKGLQEHYGAGETAVYRWLRETGIVLNGRRPVPADFAERVAELVTAKALASHYDCTPGLVRRWMHAVSGEDVVLLMRGAEVPADFAECAKTMHQEALRRRYGVSSNKIARWAMMAGVKPSRAPSRQPANTRLLPADFADMARTLTKTKLAEHYMARDATIRRWIAESGAVPVVYRPPVVATTMRRPARYNITPTGGRGNRLNAERITTIHEDAADVLRRFGPVYRCDDNGAANPHGKLWRIGCGFPITGDELLARAERHRRKAA